MTTADWIKRRRDVRQEWAAEHGAAEWADLAPGLPAHWWVADRPTRVLTKSWGKP